MHAFMGSLRPALVSLLALTALTGVAYPALVTGLAALLFPHQSRGSIERSGDGLVGSALVGQRFVDPAYLWPRPSATSPDPYTALTAGNGGGSSGSNLGPTNDALLQAARQRMADLKRSQPPATPSSDLAVPSDLVLASASGLDPHISPQAAFWQVDRIAAARGVPPETVRAVVQRHREDRTLGFLGEPRVNVLLVNLDLDRELGKPNR